MKKGYILLILMLMSSFIFAQNAKFSKGTLNAVPVQKEINTLQNNAKAVLDSLHYDGINDNSIGTGVADDFGVYAFFPNDSLLPSATAGYSILSVKLYINGATNVSAGQLRIYADTTTPIYTQNFTAVEGWNEVFLTTPMAVPSSGNLYVGYNITVTGGYPAGCDAGPVAAGGNGNWMYYGGWYHLTDLAPTLTGNWNIRAMIGTVPTTPTANCTPLTYDAGNVIVSQTATSGTFSLSNVGAGTLTCSGITGLSAPWTTTLVPASVSLATGASTTFTFTYSPTAAGANNQTVVIATNGGDITINLTGTGIECTAISSYPWTEGFEGSFLPACWSLNDVDADGNNWAQVDYEAHSGTYAANSASYDNALGVLYPDNYLITPQFTINAANLELTYWVIAVDGDWPEENYDVLVSTTGTALTDFTSVFNETLTANDSTYQERVISLAGYNGQNIYIAFRHHDVSNMFSMNIDDLTIQASTGIEENTPVVSVYPNPAENYTTIVFDGQANLTISDMSGRTIYAAAIDGTTNVSTINFTAGMYIVKCESDGNVFTSKLFVK